MSGPAAEPSAVDPEPSAVGADRTDRGDRAAHRDGPGPASAPSPPGLCSSVRRASPEDVPTVVEAVRGLLLELGGTPPPTSAMQAAARALLGSPQAGELLVMEADGRMPDAEYNHAIVGVLGVSWQSAIHIPGRYALIQNLWVHPSWRRRAVGRELLKRLVALAHEQEIARIEVGLPPEGYRDLEATRAFYGASGFESLGPRMRLRLG
jgi:GNAT superfamily N-acetyltransferase